MAAALARAHDRSCGTSPSTPSASIDTCAPPPVSPMMAPTGSSFAALIVWSAPSPCAAASFSSETSTAMTFAPIAAAICTRREADAAAAVHRHPLARPRPSPGRRSRVERRHVAAAHARARRRTARRRAGATRFTSANGTATLAAVTRPSRRRPGTSGVSQTFWCPVRHHSHVPSPWLNGHQHAVAGLPVLDVRADLLDHAAELVAEDVRRRELRSPTHVQSPGPEVPVGAADPVGLDADHGAVRGPATDRACRGRRAACGLLRRRRRAWGHSLAC